MSDITLKQGDCLEVMKEIPNSSVDLILCDLPYGTTACKWDTILQFRAESPLL
jgi:site-specific DNA-methyltransferase (adenine-specific)